MKRVLLIVVTEYHAAVVVVVFTVAFIFNFPVNRKSRYEGEKRVINTQVTGQVTRRFIFEEN